MNGPARRLAALLGVIAVALVACGGGGGHHATATTATTSPVSIPAPVSRDVWNPPDLSGPQSAGTFCAGLTADLRHARLNSIATTPAVKAQILGDFQAYTPKVVAAAPAEIRAPATTYLGALERIVQVLSSVGYDAAKTPPGALGDLLVDPQVRAAQVSLAGWSQTNCHFDIISTAP